MELESAVDELYAGSPDDFIERRKTLVSQARAAKDRALATAVGALRRPTRSAWLVNLFAREAPDELGGLLDLGEALQNAQRQLSGPDLRRLSADRGKALAAATRQAVDLGHARGYDAPEAVRLEVSQTLQAALADADVAEQVRTGTVTQAQAYGGFGPFALTPPEAAGTPEPQREPKSEAEPDSEPDSEAEPEPETPADDRAALRAEAESRLQTAEAELSEAADQAEATTARADELADRVEALRAEVADAERAAAEAHRQARAARKTVADLEEAVRAARQAYEAL